jgi:thiol-disulfide isomerase/thioredoxin
MGSVPAFALAAIIAVSATGLATVRFDAPPPDFTLSTRSGMQHVRDLRGKPLVIHFWATWCHVCLDELSLFDRLRKSYGMNVRIVTLSNEPTGVARAYLRAHDATLPLREDPQSAIFLAYSITPLPTTVIVNAAGNVSYVSVGEMSWDELQTSVRAAAAGTQPLRVLR